MLLLMFLIVPKKSTILNRVAITTLCDFFIITEQFIIFGHDHCIIARTILDLGTIIVSSHALSYIRARSLYHRTHYLIFGHDHCIIARTILFCFSCFWWRRCLYSLVLFRWLRLTPCWPWRNTGAPLGTILFDCCWCCPVLYWPLLPPTNWLGTVLGW